MDNQAIRVLLVEDDPGDEAYIREVLSEGKDQEIHLETTDRVGTALARMEQGDVDLVLLDLSLPDSTGLATFQKMYKAWPRVPIVLLTGLDDYQMAVKAVSEGAQDYLIKKGLDTGVLLRAIRYGVERQALTLKLQKALEEVKRLKNLLPICAGCKKIRDDQGYWQSVEKYLLDHAGVQFSHGLCPDCVRKLYPDMADELLGETEG